MNLMAGELSVEYEGGFLYRLQYHHLNLIQRIYFAVRDDNWNTIPLQIQEEKISKSEHHFCISYHAITKLREIDMDWEVRIEGTKQSLLVFTIVGITRTAFKKNRIGLCILQGIKETMNKPFTVKHADGTMEIIYFPHSISPSVIATNIKEMSWRLPENVKALCAFDGDLFEIEDQRNWTDYSFKTYCTPLTLPFPVSVSENHGIQQSVTITVTGHPVQRMSVNGPIRIQASGNKVAIPSIGIARSPHEQDTTNYLAVVRSLQIRHYRVEIYPGVAGWSLEFQIARKEARSLSVPMEIIFFFSSNYQLELAAFTGLSVCPEEIKYITLLPNPDFQLSTALLFDVFTTLKSVFPTIPVGSGTDANFAELNRSSLDFRPVDFVCYSVNPQVHLEDDQTLIENLQAQRDTVLSARHKFPGKKIHISPVTLKPRTNPVATNPGFIYSKKDDPRQKTHFGAGWLLGSLKNTLEAQTDSITYFEVSGPRGLMETSRDGAMIQYPTIKILEAVLDKKWTHVLPGACNLPEKVSSLVLTNDDEYCFLFANHTDCEQELLYTNYVNEIVFSKFLQPFDILIFTL